MVQVVDRRGLLAVLLKVPAQAPLSPNDAGTTLLEKLLQEPVHEVYAKAIRPMDHHGTELAHDVRVGTRRLTEALELVEPLLEKRVVRRAQKRARDLRRAFGDKRVADVLLEDLQELLKDAGIPAPSGLQAFAAKGERGLEEALKRYPPERVLRHGLDVLKMGQHPRRAELTLVDVAGRHLYRRANEAEPLIPALNDLRELETHHRLRIRIKRLRYTLEICASPFASTFEAKPALGTLRQHQSLLGRLNDAKELVLWLHDPELVELLHPELAAQLIVRARRLVEQRWEEAKTTVLAELPPLLDQLRRTAGLLDHQELTAPA
jgi:CHAD domain-containing protein